MYRNLVVLFVTALLSQISEAYPNGAPPGVCGTLVPGHRAEASKDKSPFSLKTSNEIVKLGENVNLTIVVDGTATFKGFLIEARDSANNSKIVGSFLQPAEEFSAKLLQCENVDNTAVTHYSNIVRSSLNVTWASPSDAEAEIYFQATILSSYDTFWTEIKSTSVKVTSSASFSASSVSLLFISVLIQLGRQF